MRNIRQMKIQNKQTIKKIIALVCLVCFFVIVLLLETFTFIYASHEHNHHEIDGGCTFCVEIHRAESMLKQFAAVVMVILPWQIGLFAAAVIVFFVLFSYRNVTLVNLKVRINY